MSIRFAPQAAAALALTVATGCSDSRSPDASNVQFDSAHSIASSPALATARTGC